MPNVRCRNNVALRNAYTFYLFVAIECLLLSTPPPAAVLIKQSRAHPWAFGYQLCTAQIDFTPNVAYPALRLGQVSHPAPLVNSLNFFFRKKNVQAIFVLCLEYSKWSNFSKVIDRAMLACKNSGFEPSDQFAEVGKLIEHAKGDRR